MFVGRILCGFFLVLAASRASAEVRNEEKVDRAYDFSERISLIIRDREFYFERCKLDVCHPITKRLPRVADEETQRRLANWKWSEGLDPQHIADVYLNYNQAKSRYEKVTYGISRSPEVFDVWCSLEVAEFLKKVERSAAKSEPSSYVFKFTNKANQTCKTKQPGDPVRGVDGVEQDSKRLEREYLQVLKTLKASAE